MPMRLPILILHFIATACLSMPCFSKQIITAGNVVELKAAVSKANKSANTTIFLKDGHYRLTSGLHFQGNQTTLASLSGDLDKVVLSGNGMQPAKNVVNLITVSGKNFTLDGVTLKDVSHHLVQVRGEADADGASFRNCRLINGYQQLLKVSYNQNNKKSADGGLIEECEFGYTANVGPNWYIGGIDIHAGKNWIIQNNRLFNIASPAQRIAEPAIHVWNWAEDTIVRGNLIFNSDRGIGLGMGERGHNRGKILKNTIVHTNQNNPFSDVGIIIENSYGTSILQNKIYIQHDYPNAIEYRFKQTKDAVIEDNIVNKAIVSRNGGRAKVGSNKRVNSAEEMGLQQTSWPN